MHHIMAKFWWIVAIRGILGILLGLVTIGWVITLNGHYPDFFGVSLFARWAMIAATLVLILGIYAFLDGLFAVLLGLQDYGDGRRWGGLAVEGLLGIGLGVITWIKPGSLLFVLLYWVAGWAFLTGMLEMFQAYDLNEYKERRRPMFFAGLCSTVFGVLILAFRESGITLVWLMGVFAFAFGIPLLIYAFRLRHFFKASFHTR